MNPTLDDRITKTPGVCGGSACLRGRRIPVWGLVEHKRLGATDAEILQSIQEPPTQEDLDAAWAYAEAHSEEIEQEVWLNDAIMLEPAQVESSEDFIQQGRRIGLSDDQIRDAFDPPLTQYLPRV